MTIDNLISELRKAVDIFEKNESFVIIFSDDGDGISSAAVIASLLEKQNKDYILICLDKIIPEALNTIYKLGSDSYIFLDLGGPINLYIPSGYKLRTIIIDHHEEMMPPDITYINPVKYGETGNYAVTSVLAYFIHRIFEGKRTDTAPLSLIGVGEVRGEFTGLNWAAYTDAMSMGSAERVSRGNKISYRVIIDDKPREIVSLYKDITLISSVKYYLDGPTEAVESLVFKDLSFIKNDVEEARKKRQLAFSKGMGHLEDEGLFQLKKVQWFIDMGYFKGMGTRVFDSFTSYVRYQSRLIDRGKHILGVMERDRKVPGLGKLKNTWINIAIRVPKYIETLILAGKSQPISALAEAVAYQVGGIGYGYKQLGSAIVPKGFEDHFISLYNDLLGGNV